MYNRFITFWTLFFFTQISTSVQQIHNNKIHKNACKKLFKKYYICIAIIEINLRKTMCLTLILKKNLQKNLIINNNKIMSLINDLNKM